MLINILLTCSLYHNTYSLVLHIIKCFIKLFRSTPHLEFVVDPPHRLAGLTITEVSDNHVNWNLQLREELERFHLNHPHVNRCPTELYARVRSDPNEGDHGRLSDGRSENSEDSGNLVSYPTQAVPYRPRRSCSFKRKA